MSLTFWGCICAAHASDNYNSLVHFTGIVQPGDDDTFHVYTPVPHAGATEGLPRILPQPGAKLNYTQIMFEHASVTGADQYLIEVTLDDSLHSFTHPLFKQKDSSTAAIISNFEFGKKYVWRYTGLQNQKKLGWNGPYNFEILNSPLVDKKLIRVRVLQNDSLQNNGGLVVLDASGNIVDRKGNFVWFFPWQPVGEVNETIQGFINAKNIDMHVTPSGAITSIINHKAQERDLNGNTIWEAPRRSAFYHDSLKSVSPYNYHHCFKKLENGHYMVLDMEYFTLPDSLAPKARTTVNGTAKTEAIIPYEIIKEFDRNNNLVWSWRTKNYFDTLDQMHVVNGKADSLWHTQEREGHMNAFDADEKNGFVYAGFRNLNRVIKIDKKSGQVVCSWGDDMSYRDAPNGDGFFYKQHGSNILHDGSIAVYNNNPKPVVADTESAVSSVVIFSQPANGINSKIIWKFDCRLDPADNMSSVSGNVDELKNGNLLVCMGAVNRIFEITRNKKIVWNALIEKYKEIDSTWEKFHLYRAHYVSSLYPCYFTLQTSQKVLNDGRITFKLKIFNDGTEDDSYRVDITSSPGNYHEQFTTGVLPAKRSINFEIAPARLPVEDDIIEATVISNTNPGFKRVIRIQ